MGDLPDSDWIFSLGGVPLISKDKVLGVLIVATTSLHEFEESEQELLATVGKTMA